MPKITIDNFSGGLNTGESTAIADNQLAVAQNVSYDNQGILGIRPGIKNFGNEISGAAGVSSIYFTKFTDGTRILLAAEGTTMYKYNEGTSDWDSIKTGLTDGLDYSFLTYKDLVYWTNGTDNFMSYDGTTVSEHAAVPKGKYMALENDLAYMAGVSTDPSTVFYTNANPATLHADGFQNDEPVNQDEGIITGLAMFGPLLVVGKDQGVYLVNVFASPVSIDPLDFDGDVQSHRSMVNVENDLLFMSDRGVYSMAQRQGTTASYRAFPWSNSIDKEIKKISDKSSCAAIYFPRTNNVFFAVDSGEVNRNDKMFVYSTLVSSPGQRRFTWTEYLNINANDFTVYEDSAGEEHLLVANAFGGQIIEMEAVNQFTDNEQAIRSIIRTKTFDFAVPEAYKLFEQVNLVGFITENEEVTFTLTTDGVETSKTFTGASFATGDDADSFPLGEEDIGIDPVGSGPVGDDGLTYYPFVQRRSYFKYGLRLTVQIETNSVNSGLKITKLSIPVEAMDDTAFPTDFITT